MNRTFDRLRTFVRFRREEKGDSLFGAVMAVVKEVTGHGKGIQMPPLSQASFSSPEKQVPISPKDTVTKTPTASQDPTPAVSISRVAEFSPPLSRLKNSQRLKIS